MFMNTVGPPKTSCLLRAQSKIALWWFNLELDYLWLILIYRFTKFTSNSRHALQCRGKTKGFLG